MRPDGHRTRQANAATARAFALVIEPGFDAQRAALVLADSSPAPYLEEALAHLRPTLFGDDDDRVASEAARILQLALRRRAA